MDGPLGGFAVAGGGECCDNPIADDRWLHQCLVGGYRRGIRKRRLSAPPYAADLWNRSITSPPFASIARWDAMLSASVVSSTYASPSSLACGSSNCKARVAYPRRRFHGTTEYPMCPRQYGGSSVVPGCQRKPIAPQNSPSHIHREYPGRRDTVEPSGRVTGGPLASRSTCSERKRAGFCAIRASSSRPACGRRLSGDQSC